MTELLAHTVAPSSLTTGSAPLLAIRDLSVEFGPTDRPVRVVDGLDLDVAAGETFALVGESGSGKSITAAAVLGVLPGGARIASGRIALDGDDLVDGGRRTKVRFQGSRIGMVFQNPMASLDPSFKIGNQLREIIALHRPATSRRRRDEFAEAWLRNVGIADTARVLGSYPHELSGGMRQRVMIALAALSEPALLIADEPTTALDAVIQKQILDLLVSVTDRTGSALLLITHDFGVVSHVARKVAVMKDGRIVERGERARVLSAPADPYTASLIGSVPELGARTRLEDGGLPRRLGVLDAATPAAVPVPVPTGHVECSVLVELDSVSKEFVVGGIGTGQPKRRFLAVDDVSLTIRRGEVFGLIGESGSGKSTLARLIGGLQPVTSGGVTFDGHRIDELSKSEVRRLRPRFQYVFQDATSSLNPRVRVGEQVARPLVRFGKVDSRRAAEQRVSEVLELVGLPRAYADRYPHELSGGQRQRIGVARALALEPELLILDEPTSALDVSTQATILNLLLDLRDQLELTYLFIAHNLALVEFLCDRVGVLQDGRLLETFVTADLTTADRHHVTRGLLEAVLPIHRTDDPTPRSTP